jgi:hypothetical protein
VCRSLSAGPARIDRLKRSDESGLRLLTPGLAAKNGPSAGNSNPLVERIFRAGAPMLTFVLWCILFVLCWPLALLSRCTLLVICPCAR